MKICISATGNNLDAALDPRFGRAGYFLIVDDKGKLVKAIKNTGVQAMRGAGVTAAQIVVNENVDILITANIGPNASMILGNSGIKIFFSNSIVSVKDIIQEYQQGKLKEVTEAIHSRPGLGGQFGQRGRDIKGSGRERR